MRRPGDPFLPGTRVWFRENTMAYAAAHWHGFAQGKVLDGRATSDGHKTLVEVPGRVTAVWVFTDRLRSSPPRWATGKALPPKPPKEHVRKEAIDTRFGEEATLL